MPRMRARPHCAAALATALRTQVRPGGVIKPELSGARYRGPMLHRPGAPGARPSPPASPARTLVWTFAALLGLLAWDAAGQDRLLAHAFGSATGFPLREHWFLVQVMHEAPRRLAWLLVLVLLTALWRPLGPLRHLHRAERWQLATATLLSLLVVSLLKYTSTTSCPWDLAEFGGVARYASHWALGTMDGGGGKCFPAGHASAGFAFIGGYFALRHRHARVARFWLAGALLAGLALGCAQQVRGAHYLSHTLWTGWLCWTTGWLCDLGFRAFMGRLGTAPTTALDAA